MKQLLKEYKTAIYKKNALSCYFPLFTPFFVTLSVNLLLVCYPLFIFAVGNKLK